MNIYLNCISIHIFLFDTFLFFTSHDEDMFVDKLSVLLGPDDIDYIDAILFSLRAIQIVVGASVLRADLFLRISFLFAYSTLAWQRDRDNGR